MDARVVDQPHDPMVSSSVLLAEELAQLDEQLAAEHFVAVHVAHVLELGLHWGRKRERVRMLGGAGVGSKSRTELPSVTFPVTT